MKLKTNLDNDELYCIYSKEKIEIGERYVEVEEDYLGDIIQKTYKPEYAPTEDEDENDGLYLG